MATLLRAYHVGAVTGDHYSAGWVADAFRRRQIEYHVSAKDKSTLYVETLPLINSAQVEIPNLPRLRHQLVGLERKTSRSGKDSVDHRPGGKDDVANAACGALVLASKGRTGLAAAVAAGKGMADTLLSLNSGRTGSMGIHGERYANRGPDRADDGMAALDPSFHWPSAWDHT